MRKILLTLVAVICCHLALCAQVINEQEAKQRALEFLNNRDDQGSVLLIIHL